MLSELQGWLTTISSILLLLVTYWYSVLTQKLLKSSYQPMLTILDDYVFNRNCPGILVANYGKGPAFVTNIHLEWRDEPTHELVTCQVPCHLIIPEQRKFLLIFVRSMDDIPLLADDELKGIERVKIEADLPTGEVFLWKLEHCELVCTDLAVKRYRYFFPVPGNRWKKFKLNFKW